VWRGDDVADEATAEPKRRIPSYRPESAYNASLEGPTAVYRLYDAAGQLLYVGISKNLEQRWYDHSLKKLWWHRVVDKKVDWYDSRSEALIAEEETERLEGPRYCDAARFGPGWHSIERVQDPSLQEATDSLAQHFREAIVRGDYAPGAKMPSDRKLAETHQVSISMVTSALGQLTGKDGLVWRVTDGYAVRPDINIAGAAGAESDAATPERREQQTDELDRAIRQVRRLAQRISERAAKTGAAGLEELAEALRAAAANS
jgi:DNA-binding transcriptional regulator YhcF (GntR family)/predicted GIY-YIG superfamily endonuclease